MAQFDVEGTWTLQQTTGHTVELNIAVQRPDGEFGATAKVLQGGNLGAGFGRVENEQFRVTIGWNGGSKGVYIGEFDTSGVLNGATFDVAHPEVHAGWKSTRAFSRQ